MPRTQKFVRNIYKVDNRCVVKSIKDLNQMSALDGILEDTNPDTMITDRSTPNLSV